MKKINISFWFSMNLLIFICCYLGFIEHVQIAKTVLFLAIIFCWIVTIFNIFIISLIHMATIVIPKESNASIRIREALKFDKPKGPVPYWINLIVDFCLIAILASNGWIIIASIQVVQTIVNELIVPWAISGFDKMEKKFAVIEKQDV